MRFLKILLSQINDILSKNEAALDSSRTKLATLAEQLKNDSENLELKEQYTVQTTAATVIYIKKMRSEQ